jgi:Putative MetA-pathway of phenol degradation
MAKPIFNLVRVCTRPVRQSIFDFARCASIAGALCATSPVCADSSDGLSNETGDDPTHPLGKIELLDRFTTAPGPGTAEGTTKQVDTNTLFARIETPFRIAPQWELAFRVEIPVVWTNPVTPQNPSGQVITGFGNVLTQSWLIYEINPRWAVAAGAQVIAPTATNGVASDAW